MSGLYEYTNYTNEFIDHLYNVEIIEYDMRDAGLSLSKKYKLLPETTIKYLENLSKNERKVVMGIMQRNDKEFRKAHNEAFKLGRKLFFEENELDSSNVLSIKKDAIFALKRCENVEFNELVFVPKNVYTSYYRFDRYEYYYYSNGLDVKGIADDKLMLHREFMISALHEFMYLMEKAKTDKVIRFLKEFIYYYKTKQLSVEFYRELNRDSMYRLDYRLNNQSFAIDHVDSKEDILINYNFNTYLTPLIDIVLRRE